MLALEHIRINHNYGPFRRLDALDTEKTANALSHCPPVQQNDRVLSAVLYAIHALSFLVRVGQERVARSPYVFWTVRHSLSGFECALILSHCLAAVDRTSVEMPLYDPETRTFHWVKGIAQEAYAVADFDDGDYTFGESAAFMPQAVLKIWAHFFIRNTKQRYINVIGEGLEQDRLKCLDDT